VSFGFVYPALYFGWLIIILYAHYELFKRYRVSRDIERNQLLYVSIGTAIGFVGAALNFFPVFGIMIYPYSNFLPTIYCITATYAILKYNLMDIRIVLTRAGIFAVVYFPVVFLPFWIAPRFIHTGFWWIPTLLMGILATLGIFIYNTLRKRAEARLLAEDLKRYETLKRFARTVGLIRDLDELVKLIVYRLVKTLRIAYGAIYLFDDEEGSYILKSIYSLRPTKPSLLASISKDSDLIKFILKHQKEFLLEDIQRLTQEKPSNKNNKEENNQIDIPNVISQLKQFNTFLVIPHFLEKDLVGFLILGEKLSGRAYSEADLDVLAALARPAGLAILNALSIIDLKKTEFELAEASRVAQIGYLASATGHQISNVLNNIAAIANGLLENESVLDSLKDKPEAYSALEKHINNIFTNVEDGGLIIREIRDYAQRDEEKKFTLVDLKDVVDKTLKILYIPVNKFQTVDFKVNISSDIPKILGSPVQLQNVLINLCNNGYDTILSKRDYTKEHPELDIKGYKGRIEINISKVKNKVHIHIIDDGMGIPAGVQKRLFTPLYTTKASSIKRQEKKLTGGTGIGLYTILLIIKNHSGSIRLYQTEFLKRADFLIELPIPNESDIPKE
jgi:signal transduction histidine kinase